jgi:hypothetical protein
VKTFFGSLPSKFLPTDPLGRKNYEVLHHPSNHIPSIVSPDLDKPRNWSDTDPDPEDL